MTDTANLGLPFIEGSQAQKHITHNDALRILDTVVQIAVLDMARTTPPGAPAEGERYVVATGATGAWAGQANAIAVWQDGAWMFLVPKAGWCLWSIPDETIFSFTGAAWQKLAPPADNVSRLGINTTAADPDLLSVKSNTILFAPIAAADGGNGDTRVQISKEASANTASVFFSDNYSGRAEFGLTGDDDFRLKVSADGAGWQDAFVIDKATAQVAFKGFSDQPATRALLAAAPIDALAFGGMQINGGMEVSQENGSNSVTVSSAAKYIVDGIQVEAAGTMVVVAKQDAAPTGMPANKALKISVTTAQASLSASHYCVVSLPVEGFRTGRLLFGTALASPVSIGFWFQGPAATYSGALRNGAVDRSYPFAFTVVASGVPQWIPVTIPGDASGTWLADSGVGLRINIGLAVGSALANAAGSWTSGNYLGATGSANGVASTANTFYIGNVVVLPGTELPAASRSSLIMRPYDTELVSCKRYYERSAMVVATALAGSAPLPTLYWTAEKRATPSLSWSFDVGSGATFVNLQQAPRSAVFQNVVHNQQAQALIVGSARL